MHMLPSAGGAAQLSPGRRKALSEAEWVSPGITESENRKPCKGDTTTAGNAKKGVCNTPLRIPRHQLTGNRLSRLWNICSDRL